MKISIERSTLLKAVGQAQSVDESTFEYLLANQDPQGFWPATQPVVDAVAADDIPCDQIAFFAHYHTTLLTRDVLARCLPGMSSRQPVAREGRSPRVPCAFSDTDDKRDFAAGHPALRGDLGIKKDRGDGRDP